MAYYVYMLENASANRHYIGFTTDIERRVTEHNNGNTKSTRPFGHWKCIYLEEFNDKSEAYKREWYLKHKKGYKEKIEIIKKFGANVKEVGLRKDD